MASALLAAEPGDARDTLLSSDAPATGAGCHAPPPGRGGISSCPSPSRPLPVFWEVCARLHTHRSGSPLTHPCRQAICCLIYGLP